jgi:hypothetical protein
MSSTVISASAKNEPPIPKPPHDPDLNDLSSSSLYAVEISYGVTRVTGEAGETVESNTPRTYNSKQLGQDF